ncbi:MAG: hypothetical protein GY928_21175, partial [Colwellia sp.]|nr:hypothetical protein [Colwellia sp.]
GMAPLVGNFFDVANAGYYWYEGNKVDAGFSIGAAIPFLGWGATTAKYLSKASKGLAQNKMFRHALQPYNGGKYSNAGRALTKHPNIVGAVSKEMLGNQLATNKAAAAALKNIMRNGTQTIKATRAFGKVIEYKLGNGLGARFSVETNDFITFLGRGL